MESPSAPAPVPTNNSTSKANVGLVLGIVSLLVWIIPVVGLGVAVRGLMLSARGLQSTRPGRALGGLVLSFLGLIPATFITYMALQTLVPATIKLVRATPTPAAVAAGEAVHNSLVKGAPFPDFSFTDVAGHPRALSDYKNQVVLIDFWATWCSECVVDLPSVKAAYDKYHDQGFTVIGVSLEMGDADTFKSYLRDEGATWPQSYDGNWWNSALAVQFGVRYIPQVYLLDRHGRIIRTNPPPADWSNAIAAALSAP